MVNAPILFNCGANDLALPARCEEYLALSPNTASKYDFYPNSSHSYFDEERDSYLGRMQTWLDAND